LNLLQKKCWYGHKEPVSIDMESGLINKVATIAANLLDTNGLRHVCPTLRAIYGDKGYCAAAQRGCHLVAIQCSNMKANN